MPKGQRKQDKRHTWLSDELATSLVAEAESSLPSERRALCARYEVSEATLQRWIERVYGNERRKVAGSPELRRIVEEKKRALRKRWEDRAVRALRRGLQATEVLADLVIERAKSKEGIPLEEIPKLIHALAGNSKLTGELLIGDRVFPNADPAGDGREVRTSEAPPGSTGGAQSGGGASPGGGNGRGDGSLPDVVH
jgi:hypothetical protein